MIQDGTRYTEIESRINYYITKFDEYRTRLFQHRYWNFNAFNREIKNVSKTRLKFALLFLILVAAPQAFAQNEKCRLTVMTFNVLCSFCDRKNFDPWEERLAYFTEIISRYQPDLIGFQEISKPEEVEQIGALNPEYSSLYYKDAETGKSYPDATIFYRKDRFDLIEHGTYWLSATPDVAWSKGWAKVQFWRLVIWAHLKQKSDGREFYFATTHFDNNFPNQEKERPLVLERTSLWAKKMPSIFIGDFNSKPSSKAYANLTTGEGGDFKLLNAFDIAKKWSAQCNQTPKPEYTPDNRIDHIFLAGPTEFQVSRWTADMFVYGSNNRYPSDHFPIVAEIEF